MLPNWNIPGFFDEGAVTADKLIATYTDTAAYLADSGRANRLFAVIDGNLYYVRELEAFDDNRGLTDSNLPNAIGLPNANTVALGDNARAKAYETTAVGRDARATVASSTALGTGSYATGDGSTAVGAGAGAPGWKATAVGEGSRVFSRDSVAVGHWSRAFGDASAVMGNRATAFGRNIAAIGTDSAAIGDGNVALGRQAWAANWGPDGEHSTAIPEGVTYLTVCALDSAYVTDGQRFANDCAQSLTQAEKEHANLLPGNSAGEAYRRAIQTRLKARLNSHAANGAIAVGDRALASSGRTTAIGQHARAMQQGSTALGANATVFATPQAWSGSADWSVAIGLDSRVAGNASVALGSFTKIYGAYGGDSLTALGYWSSAIGNSNTAVGRGAEAANWGPGVRGAWDLPEGGIEAMISCAEDARIAADGRRFADFCDRALTAAERENANLSADSAAGLAFRQGVQARLRERLNEFYIYNGTALGARARARASRSTAVGARSDAFASAGVAVGAEAVAGPAALGPQGYVGVADTLPTYDDFAAYLEVENRSSGWISVDDHVYPAWEIDAFFGFGARDFAAADIVAKYDDAAAYLADGARANRPFAIIGGILYRTPGLEAARASGRLEIALQNSVPQPGGGYKAVAVGANAHAMGTYATALGGDARAAAAGALAVGAGAGASGAGEWSTAVGSWADAPGLNATALGENAGAFGQWSTAVGSLANAAGRSGTAVGLAAQTGAAADATAIGEAAVAFGAETVALGRAAVAGAEVHDIVPQNGRLWELVQCAEDAGRYVDDAVDFETECLKYLTAAEQANADMFAWTEAGEAARGAVQTRLKAQCGLSVDRATAVGAYAHASGAGSIALGRGAEAAGANAIAIGAGVAAAANEAVIGAAGHSYRLPGFAAEEGLARLLGVDSQGRLVAGGASFEPGAPELGIRVATLELDARSVGRRVGTLETTTKTIEDEVTGVDNRLGQGNQPPHADGRGEGTVFQRIAALDADMGAPDDDGRRGEDASAFQRIAALDTIIDDAVEGDLAVAAVNQKIEERTSNLDVTTDDDGYVQTGEGDGGNVREIVAETDRGSTKRVETVKIRTGTGDDRVVVTLKGATNEQIMTLVALLSNSELSNRPVTGADGEPVGTTMEEFLELDKNKALADAGASEQERAANAVSATERLAYLFQALYGKPYGETDGVTVPATDSDDPDPRSIAGRAAIIELDDRKALRKLDDAGAIDEVVVQEIGPGGGRLRTLPMSLFDGAEALAQVNALTGRVDGVRRDLNDLSERVDGSAAMASALTALPNVVPGGGRVYVGAGAGNYRGEQALALGLSTRLDRESNIFVNIGAAISTGGEVVSRIGAGVVW